MLIELEGVREGTAMTLPGAVIVARVVGTTRVGIGAGRVVKVDVGAGIADEFPAGMTEAMGPAVEEADATGALLDTTGTVPAPPHEATGPPGAV